MRINEGVCVYLLFDVQSFEGFLKECGDDVLVISRARMAWRT